MRRVFNFYTLNDISIAAIARNCDVSEVTAHNIINVREWDHLQHPEDFAGSDPHTGEFGVDLGEPFDVDEYLEPRSHSTCGHGYMPDALRLHVPDRIKRDLDLM